jgi:hypothetical protein
MPVAAPGYAPKPPAPSRAQPKKGPNLLLIGGIAAALVVVALAVVFIALGNRPAAPAAVVPTANPTAVAGPCAFLTAGTTPVSGAGGTCGLKLGSQVLGDSFAGQSALPADLTGATLDSNSTPTGKASIPVGGGFATLTAPGKGSGIGVVTGPTAADEIVIADFTPTTSGDANLGVAARCSPSDCLFLYVSPTGHVWIAQRVAGAVPVAKFNDVARVQLNQTNRLVLAVRGSQVQAWLNGGLVSSVPVDVANPGAAIFFDLNQDSSPATVNLSDLYVFAPAA